MIESHSYYTSVHDSRQIQPLLIRVDLTHLTQKAGIDALVDKAVDGRLKPEFAHNVTGYEVSYLSYDSSERKSSMVLTELSSADSCHSHYFGPEYYIENQTPPTSPTERIIFFASCLENKP